LKSSLHSLIPFLPSLLNHSTALSKDFPNYYSTKVKVKDKVTLRLAVYRQSVRLGVKPLEDDAQIFFPTEPLQ
jgi:hypothetical protein